MEAHFHFEQVDPGDQALIRAGIEYAAAYLWERARVEPPEVDVFASRDLAALAREFAEFTGPGGTPAGLFARRISGGVAEAQMGAVFVFTGAPGWVESNAVQRVRVVAHEFAHIVQLHLMGEELARRFFTRQATEPQFEGPSWLIEGTADLVSWRSMEAAGFTRLADHLERISPGAAASGLQPREMELFVDYLGGGADSMDVALLAAELLLRGKDEGVLVRYFERIRARAAWQQAFAEAFGETPQAFYARFEAHRAAGFPRR
jgi:hypothetical protein